MYLSTVFSYVIMEVAVYESYHNNWRNYMTYSFNSNGKPSKHSRGHARNQPSPSVHCIDVISGGTAIVTKHRGFTLISGSKGPIDLPKQLYDTPAMVMTETEWSPHPVCETLPARVWKQYGKIRVLWTKIEQFFPMRDFEQDKHHCMVYVPSRVVLA